MDVRRPECVAGGGGGGGRERGSEGGREERWMSHGKASLLTAKDVLVRLGRTDVARDDRANDNCRCGGARQATRMKQPVLSKRNCQASVITNQEAALSHRMSFTHEEGLHYCTVRYAPASSTSKSISWVSTAQASIGTPVPQIVLGNLLKMTGSVGTGIPCSVQCST